MQEGKTRERTGIYLVLVQVSLRAASCLRGQSSPKARLSVPELHRAALLKSSTVSACSVLAAGKGGCSRGDTESWLQEGVRKLTATKSVRTRCWGWRDCEQPPSCRGRCACSSGCGSKRVRARSRCWCWHCCKQLAAGRGRGACSSGCRRKRVRAWPCRWRRCELACASVCVDSWQG